MKTILIAALCLAATALAPSAQANSFTDELYAAFDGVSSPGNGLYGGRFEIGIQPDQGWGTGLNVTAATMFIICGCAHSSSAYLGGQPVGLVSAASNELFGSYTYAANDWLRLTGKLGIANTDFAVAMATPTSGYDLTSNSTGMNAGIGLQAALDNEFELRCQFDTVRVAGGATGINHINYASVGAVFRFR